MEITSGILTVGQIEAELNGMPEVLHRYAFDQIIVFFGIGSAGDIDELWKERRIRVDELLSFARAGQARGLFEPGDSDLYVKSPDEATTLQFCHDSDIHLESPNEEFVLEVERRWREKGFPGYRKVQGRWVPFGECAQHRV